jgi:hypothetical protein
LSNSEPAGRATDFELWIADEFGRTGSFTALVVLVTISADTVFPLCSTYLHVVGLEIDWNEIVVLFAGAGHEWDGASFFPHTAPHGGPLDNPTARLRLLELEERIDADPLVLNEGRLFDKWGRRLKVEATGLQ